jgi:hypothetical protein
MEIDNEFSFPCPQTVHSRYNTEEALLRIYIVHLDDRWYRVLCSKVGLPEEVNYYFLMEGKFNYL